MDNSGRRRHRWEKNIERDLKEIGCGCVDWIQLAQDRVWWWDLLNIGMNLHVPYMAENILL
jgi:hypothetical protein